MKTKESWITVKIKDIGRVVTGRTPSTKVESYFGTEYPFITPSDMDGRKTISETERGLAAEGANVLSSAMIPAESVMVSCIGWQMGKVAMTGATSFTNQQINTIIPNKKVDADFLYYSLSTIRPKLSNLASIGTRTPILIKSSFEEVEILFPPLPIQRKIAGILSAYDDLIENNTRRIKILEEMARTLYREWFVEFRAPQVKLRKATPEEKKVTGKDVFPVGWEVKRLGDVVTLHRGRSYRTPDLTDEGGLPFLNLKCIERGGGFRYDGMKRYKGEYKTSQIAKTGDIVVAVTDMTQERRLVAHAARVHIIGEDFAVMSMDLVKVEPNTEIAKDFLHGLLRFSNFADEVRQHANGVNVLHLNPSQIQEYEFVLPPSELRNRYADLCGSMYQESDLLQAKNANLRRTRDLLLPRLVSGELDVENVEVRMPASRGE